MINVIVLALDGFTKKHFGHYGLLKLFSSQIAKYEWIPAHCSAKKDNKPAVDKTLARTTFATKQISFMIEWAPGVLI